MAPPVGQVAVGEMITGVRQLDRLCGPASDGDSLKQSPGVAGGEARHRRLPVPPNRPGRSSCSVLVGMPGRWPGRWDVADEQRRFARCGQAEGPAFSAMPVPPPECAGRPQVGRRNRHQARRHARDLVLGLERPHPPKRMCLDIRAGCRRQWLICWSRGRSAADTWMPRSGYAIAGGCR